MLSYQFRIDIESSSILGPFDFNFCVCFLLDLPSIFPSDLWAQAVQLALLWAECTIDDAIPMKEKRHLVCFKLAFFRLYSTHFVSPDTLFPFQICSFAFGIWPYGDRSHMHSLDIYSNDARLSHIFQKYQFKFQRVSAISVLFFCSCLFLFTSFFPIPKDITFSLVITHATSWNHPFAWRLKNKTKHFND